MIILAPQLIWMCAWGVCEMEMGLQREAHLTLKVTLRRSSLAALPQLLPLGGARLTYADINLAPADGCWKYIKFGPYFTSAASGNTRKKSCQIGWDTQDFS